MRLPKKRQPAGFPLAVWPMPFALSFSHGRRAALLAGTQGEISLVLSCAAGPWMDGKEEPDSRGFLGSLGRPPPAAGARPPVLVARHGARVPHQQEHLLGSRDRHTDPLRVLHEPQPTLEATPPPRVKMMVGNGCQRDEGGRRCKKVKECRCNDHSRRPKKNLWEAM